MAAQAPGIFCLEGEWNPDLRQRWSIQPVLDLLTRLNMVTYIHRDVATREELRFYVSKLREPKYRNYPVVYLASHGDKGSVLVADKDDMGLDELAELFGDAAQGRYVFLGGCSTLFHEPEARAFLEQTGAKAVLGYRTYVDFLEAAAFEVLLLPLLTGHTGYAKGAFSQVMERYGHLARRVKFVMVTKQATLRAQDQSA